MNNTFAEQLKQQRETILAERGVTISYMQRTIVIEDIPAVPTKGKFLNEKSGDYRKRHTEREYTVEFALLKVDGEQIIPKPGDHILEGESVYEVVPDDVKQCYRPIDPDGTYVRIFVQRVSKIL